MNDDKPCILVVDDHKPILDFLAEDLGEDYRVLKATNAWEGLQHLDMQTVDLIISDVMMPEMDGFDFCKLVKSNFESSHIPIILLTAKNTLESKIDGLELGADVYIEKPFSPEFLNSQIASLLANRYRVKSYYANPSSIPVRLTGRSKEEEQFFIKLNDHIESNLGNIDLDVHHLAREMHISRPTLFRKIKAITGLTPNELIITARLKKAALLLSEGSLKIYEVNEIIGFGSLANFGRCFHKHFGMSPSEFLKIKNFRTDK